MSISPVPTPSTALPQTPSIPSPAVSPRCQVKSDVALHQPHHFPLPHHQSPTDFIRKALAQTQWPAPPSTAKSAIRYSFARHPEAFASPLAHLVDLAPEPSDYNDSDRTAVSSAAANPFATFTSTAAGSPVEGCFSDSGGSPASARDFLTSPSLFDDCDFDFEAGEQPLLPLFPGTTFDSQVNGACAHDDDDLIPSTGSPLVGTTDSSNALSDSSALVSSMGNSQSSTSTACEGGAPHDATEEQGQLDLPACRPIKTEHAMDADQPEPFRARLCTGVPTPPQTPEAASAFFPSDYEGANDPLRELVMRMGPAGDTLVQALEQLQGSANKTGGVLSMCNPDGTSAALEAVSYLSPDEIMRTSGSTLCMTMPTYASTPFASAELDHPMIDGDFANVQAMPQQHEAVEEVSADTVSLEPRAAADQVGDELASKSGGGGGSDNSSFGPIRRERPRAAVSSPVAPVAGPSSEKARKKPRAAASMATKGKRFQCEVCQKWFDRAFNLKTHMFTHEDPDTRAKNFICPDPSCRKPFGRKHDMKRHHNTVHLKTVKRSSKKSPNRPARDDDQG
ncbi:hypothetical protein ACQY0O_004305 [Thecaphora frezii]